MPSKTVVVLAVLLLIPFAPPVAANTFVVGHPDLSVTSPTGPVQASERTSLRVVVANDGTVRKGSRDRPDYEQEVTTARNVRVRINEEKLPSGIDVRTGTVTLGRLSSPASESVDFGLEIGNVTPGRYRVPVVVEYDYVRSVDYDQVEQPEFAATTETVRTSVELVVEDRPEFEVVSEATNRLFADDTGTLAFTVQNTGTRTARRISVALSTESPSLFFGPPANPKQRSSLYIDALEPGETRRLQASIGASNDVSPGQYPVRALVTFRNHNGVEETADPLRTGVTVRPARTFELRDVQTTRFRVDESEAKIRGRLVNTGGGAARNVAVRLRTGGPVTATNGEASVGDLAPGESGRVEFTVDVAADAEPGTNTVRFDVEYENAAGELRTVDDPIRRSLAIGAERTPFRVVNLSTTVTPGGSARLDVRVRYDGDEPATAVNAKLFASDPISSSDDGAYLGEMAPGDTATATFRVSATESALLKEYASSIEIRYDEPDGDTRFTDSLPIGVPVSPASGGPPLALVGGVLALAVAGLAYARYRRG